MDDLAERQDGRRSARRTEETVHSKILRGGREGHPAMEGFVRFGVITSTKNSNVTQGYCTKEELKHLVDGKVITKDTQTELTYDEGDRTIDDLWNVSFATGFLPIRVFWKMVDTILPSPAAECGKCSSDRFRNVSSTG